MTLAVNIGNTRITLGLFDGSRLVYKTELTSDIRRCADEYTVLFSSTFALGGYDFSGIGSVIISSVVPPLSEEIAGAAGKLTGCRPVFLGAGVKTGLNIKIDHHTQLGADIVAYTVAAGCICSPPFVAVDISDATTFSAVNKSGELCGVIIAAGLRMSLDALSSGAAELPYVTLAPPKNLLGKNTTDSLNSGTIYGHACMTDGIIDRICEEFNSEKVNIIATGHYAGLCLPFCRHKIEYDPCLILKGLNEINRLNTIHHVQKRYNQP